MNRGVNCFVRVILLQRLLDSNSQVNGHTDHGERPDRRRWRRKGGERVAAVGEGRRQNAEDIRRAPQQGSEATQIRNLHVQVATAQPHGRIKITRLKRAGL